MLRLLVTPRWLGWTALALVAFGTCMALASWQWDRAHREPRPVPIADERVVPLADVLATPAELDFPSGLLVRASGRYSSTGFVVTGTDAAGVRSAWAAAPFTLDGASSTVAVVRGSARPVPSAPAAGDVVVTGRLQPPATAGGRGALTKAELTARGADPRGYVVLTSQAPADARPAAVVTSPVPLASPGLRWQNSVYAVQWTMFALFVVFLWVRFFREDLRDARYPQGV